MLGGDEELVLVGGDELGLSGPSDELAVKEREVTDPRGELPKRGDSLGVVGLKVLADNANGKAVASNSVPVALDIVKGLAHVHERPLEDGVVERGPHGLLEVLVLGPSLDGILLEVDSRLVDSAHLWKAKSVGRKMEPIGRKTNEGGGLEWLPSEEVVVGDEHNATETAAT